MQINLLDRHDMTADKASEWLPVRIQKESNLGRRRLARSLMIDWENYGGANDTELIIYATNNQRAKAKGRTLRINQVTNINDAYLQYIDGRYAYIKVEYSSGNATVSGWINATVYYD